jgi:hypothetical protein
MSRTPNFVKIGPKCMVTLHEHLRVLRIISSVICSTAIERNACCASIAKLFVFIVLLTATFVHQV